MTAALGPLLHVLQLGLSSSQPMEFELYFMQVGCLSRELSGLPHEIFGHALLISRGLKSRLRCHVKMISG